MVVFNNNNNLERY